MKSYSLRAFSFLLLIGLSAPAENATNGPTIPLHFSGDSATCNPVADFMYFVPLISPVPVTSETSPGNTQVIRITSCKRSTSAGSFSVTCDMAVTGGGLQQNMFDINSTARRKKKRLDAGETLNHQLQAIEVRGGGMFRVEVKGRITNDTPTVNEVQLHFNAHGHTSPIWIDLCDIAATNGHFTVTNEVVARVNSLTFTRKSDPPTMKVAVSTIKNKDAGNGFWSNFKGRVEGATVSMFIPPLRVEDIGNQTMLDFGRALMTQEPSFTFPKARNLRAATLPADR